MGGQATSLIDRGIFNEFKTNRSFLVFSLLAIATIILGACAMGFVVMRGYQTNAATLMFFCGLAAAVVEMLTWNLFFNAPNNTPRLTPFGQANGRLLAILVVAAVVCGLVLEALTLLSYRADFGSLTSRTNIARTGILIALAYVGILAIAYQKPGFIKNAWQKVKEKYTLPFVGKIALGIVAALGLGIACGYFVSRAWGLSFFSSAFFGVAVFAVIVAFFFLCKSAGQHPERLFLAVSLAFGCFLCVCVPVETVVSWDDWHHFSMANGLSYVGNSETNAAIASLEQPNKLIESVGNLKISDYNTASIDDYTQKLNAEYETGAIGLTSGFRASSGASYLSTSTIGYIPAAIGIWLGRLIGLSFASIFILGRLFELLGYSIICFIAIKIIPTRKVIMGVIALLPEMIFLASMYSYDYWLNAFTLLGVALVVRELVNRNEVIKPKNWFAIVMCFLLAVMVKLIYFPLFGLLFLLPRTKFSSKKHRVLVYVSVVCAILLSVAAFAVPFVFASTAVGSSDGGDVLTGNGISADGQVAFILSQPLTYAGILGNFLATSFLSISGAEEFSSLFAYFGRLSASMPYLAGVTVVLLVSAALTDCDEQSSALCKKGNIIWTAIIFIGTVVLVATALYVDYTPVGYGTINGCQPRYLLPMLFPLFALVINPKMQLLGKSSTHALVFFSLIAAFNAVCCWVLVGLILVA